MDQELRQIASFTSTEIFSTLAGLLTRADQDSLSDDKLAEEYLFNERRRALTMLIEWKIAYEENVKKLDVFRTSKTEDPAKLQALTNNMNNALQKMTDWTIRLQSVLKVHENNEIVKIIAENYGNTNPAQGIKGSTQEEGLREETKPKSKSVENRQKYR